MDLVDLKELIDAKLELMKTQVQHTNDRITNINEHTNEKLNAINERLDKVINNLKWVLGIMVPVLTVILQTIISKLIP